MTACKAVAEFLSLDKKDFNVFMCMISLETYYIS